MEKEKQIETQKAAVPFRQSVLQNLKHYHDDEYWFYPLPGYKTITYVEIEILAEEGYKVMSIGFDHNEPNTLRALCQRSIYMR